MFFGSWCCQAVLTLAEAFTGVSWTLRMREGTPFFRRRDYNKNEEPDKKWQWSHTPDIHQKELCSCQFVLTPATSGGSELGVTKALCFPKTSLGFTTDVSWEGFVIDASTTPESSCNAKNKRENKLYFLPHIMCMCGQPNITVDSGLSQIQPSKPHRNITALNVCWTKCLFPKIKGGNFESWCSNRKWRVRCLLSKQKSTVSLCFTQNCGSLWKFWK